MYKSILILFIPFISFSQKWQAIQSSNTCTARGESALATVNGKIYLLGSRGIKPVDELNIRSGTWSVLTKPPLEMHHFQAISYKNEIWVLGAFTGNYPHETPIDHVYIFNPKANAWRQGPAIPKDILRGSAGVTLYKNKIYLVCGIQDGHWDGHSSRLDEFDPKKNKWTRLADAPHARNHITVQVINDKLYVIGGRRTEAKTNNVINIKEGATDVYDFKTDTWTTLSSTCDLPTLRAGTSTVAYKDQLIVLGGESDKQVPAHAEVEVLDIKNQTWSRLTNMIQGRHGTGAVLIKNKIYIVGGAGNRGGGPELNTGEFIELK